MNVKTVNIGFPRPLHRGYNSSMEPQRTSTSTILIRLAACAAIGLGVMLVFVAFSAFGTGTIGFAGVLTARSGAFLLYLNPRVNHSAGRDSR